MPLLQGKEQQVKKPCSGSCFHNFELELHCHLLFMHVFSTLGCFFKVLILVSSQSRLKIIGALGKSQNEGPLTNNSIYFCNLYNYHSFLISYSQGKNIFFGIGRFFLSRKLKSLTKLWSS